MSENNQLIQQEISDLQEDHKKFKGQRHEHLFSAVVAKYFYFSGEYGPDKYTQQLTDGADDGGIDLAFIDPTDSNQDPTIILIQSKYSESFSNVRDYKKELNEAINAINDFRCNQTSGYNKKIRSILRNALNEIDAKNFVVEYNFFTTTTLTETNRKNIEKELDARLKEVNHQLNESGENYTFEYAIYTLDQIAQQIEIVKNPKKFVEEDQVKFYKSDGALKYVLSENIHGIIVNVSSREILKLYESHLMTGGLFAQNNRFFVKAKKIDDKILDTISQKAERFWFLNNGITIACENFYTDGDVLRLENFSIINGCQTTTLIGKADDLPEFKVQLKVIGVNLGEDTENLVSKIAEASNSQKPIYDRDLKSNAPEQTALQQKFERNSPPIFIEIKRGAKKKKQKQHNDWQYLTNEKLGQYLLSFQFQMPGTARSKTKAIFSDDEIYNTLFKRNFDPAHITDLLKLQNEISNIQKNLDINFSDEIQEAIANGEQTLLACIGFILKVKKKLISIEQNTFTNDESLKKLLLEDNLFGIFLDDRQDNFEEIFESLIINLSKLIIGSYLKNPNKTTISNYLKSDKNFRQEILQNIYQEVFIRRLESKEFWNKYGKIFLLDA